jgi:ATP-dependent RNA circularization protein (DNA/RNA ligase family)
MNAPLLATPVFEDFPKIARLSRECCITEKIDGTNAQVVITEDGQVLAGSRTRFITPEDDNYGFAGG